MPSLQWSRKETSSTWNREKFFADRLVIMLEGKTQITNIIEKNRLSFERIKINNIL